MAMCTGVATWFKQGGPLTVGTLIDQYVYLARNLVAYRAETTTAALSAEPTLPAGPLSRTKRPATRTG